MIRLIIFILILSVIEFYAFQAFKSAFKSSWVNYTYWIVTILILAYLLFEAFTFDRSEGPSTSFTFIAALFILVFVPKLVTALIMFGEDIVRVLAALYQKVISDNGFHVPSRRKFIGQIALGVFAVQFGSILYGIFKGKYNYKVLKYTLNFEDLPDAFDGYKITQISDIHSGSFDNKEKVEYAVDLINEQAADVILFTGDIVNNRATELVPWKNTFNRLKAKDGLFSVLGNHDYGDYVPWENEVAKQKNLDDLKQLQKDIGFDLLLNESRYIEKNGERIALIGVENWGKGGFKKAGDLKKATLNIGANDFKILMSHDPSHWEAEVVPDNYHYHLTLSGHTHGMQFGIEIPGLIKWSPVKWRYKQWAGIYKKLGQYINVNRGFGYLAFPGRVGIWPEITVIELKKGSKTT